MINTDNELAAHLELLEILEGAKSEETQELLFVDAVLYIRGLIDDYRQEDDRATEVQP